MDFIFNCPVYFQNLIDRLIERNWLVHNFPSVENEELYNFANYKENKISHDVSYTIYLDLNIYQYILNSVKKM